MTAIRRLRALGSKGADFSEAGRAADVPSAPGFGASSRDRSAASRDALSRTGRGERAA